MFVFDTNFVSVFNNSEEHLYDFLLFSKVD